MLVVAGSISAPVAQRLDAELRRVEARFTAELHSDLACVQDLVRHVERYRGKMLRPTLVLASALACGGDEALDEPHRVVAAVVEMIHVATLVHDDVLDEARLRRRATTVNGLAGNETAVMLGDLLFSHAYHMVSSLARPDIARILCQATNTVCEGELLQLANRNNRQLAEDVYFDIIGRKTAALCGVSCRVGALLSGASVRVAGCLAQYGESLGTAYQIVDDLLDLTGDQQTVGKTLGRDLQKGKLTLPLIHHLRTVAAADRPALLTLIERACADNGDGALSPQVVGPIRELLDRTDSLEYAGCRARELTDAARQAALQLPDSPGRSFLLDVAQAVLTRRF